MSIDETKHLIFWKLNSSSQAPVIYLSLKVFPDFTWKAFFCGKEVVPSCRIFEDVPTKLTNAQRTSCSRCTVTK